MNPSRPPAFPDAFALAGIALLGAFAAAIVWSVVTQPDQRRALGYEPGRSLAADCGIGGAAFFTDRTRRVVHAVRRDGRVASVPLLRVPEGPPVAALQCLDHGAAFAVAIGDQVQRHPVAWERGAGGYLAAHGGAPQAVR